MSESLEPWKTSIEEEAPVVHNEPTSDTIQSVTEALMFVPEEDESFPEENIDPVQPMNDQPLTKDVSYTTTSCLPGSGSSSTLAPGSFSQDEINLAELELDLIRNEAARRRRNGSGTSVAEGRLRVLQLQRDVRAASVNTQRRSNAGLFKSVCSTDLLFLVDTTSSMHGHIQAAKEQVKSIIYDIKRAFLNEAEVRIAIVGYKDHADKPHIQFLDFTRDVEIARKFIDGLSAVGGADIPEDVLGGLRQALNATWKNQTRCIVHIADAPAHGHNLHDMKEKDDTYFVPGSEPHSLTHEPLLKKMLGLKINYALLRINEKTDRMAFEFFKMYNAASAGCKLHRGNVYYGEACDMAKSYRDTSRGKWSGERQSGLLFEETELGTTYSALSHLVVRNVTSSASRTAVRMSGSGGQTTKTWANKMLDHDLAAIVEDEIEVEKPLPKPKSKHELERVKPEWDTPGWLDEMLIVEGFSPAIGVHGANTLRDIMAHDDNIKMSFMELTILKRAMPFAQGAMRLASYARTATSTNRFVVKSFKRDGKQLAHVAEDMRAQALCKAFALEFNAQVSKTHALDFITTTCLRSMTGMTSADDCMSLEPYIEGTYVKYNSNWGWVNEENILDNFNMAAQAFSHFTFERSRGQFLVSDLQGVGGVLTDPAIHTLDPKRFKLADTNLGQEGFKFFFASHKCNAICNQLRLKSKATMFISNKFEFRKDWPRMGNMVCCSNKLCGKIVPLANTKKTEQFPGHLWCRGCWDQLWLFTSKQICAGPGPQHEFEDSLFFYESQGRSTQNKCVVHRGEDSTKSRTTILGKFDVSRFFRESGRQSAASTHVGISGNSRLDDAETTVYSEKDDRLNDPNNQTTMRRTSQPSGSAVEESRTSSFGCGLFSRLKPSKDPKKHSRGPEMNSIPR